MRDLKFRIYDTKLKCYGYGCRNSETNKYDKSIFISDKAIGFHTDPESIYTSINFNKTSWHKIYGNERYIIEQFTGLKDKTGKDVYEGDVLKYDYENIVEYVDWDFDNASFRAMPTGLYGDDLTDYSQVIGNIHENPELL